MTEKHLNTTCVIYIMNFVRKQISITKKQNAWVINKHINLSRFVQAKIDKELKK